MPPSKNHLESDMEITDEMISKLADLSRLTFEGEERVEIKKDLEKMIAFYTEKFLPKLTCLT